jgi:hypothetical protein
VKRVETAARRGRARRSRDRRRARDSGARGDKVAEVSKRWFRVRDTYGIEIAEGADDALILAITVCIDQMTHDVG